MKWRHPKNRMAFGDSSIHIDLASTVCLIAACLIAISICQPALRAKAQSGALIPVSVKNEPDSSILSLQVMKVDVTINNQHARVKILQIFDSHTSQVLEGQYLFALPSQSSIADFAVWDG